MGAGEHNPRELEEIGRRIDHLNKARENLRDLQARSS